MEIDLDMSTTSFPTSTETFRKLMGNGIVYIVPPFQRDYSWEQDQWEDLWQDVLGIAKEGGEPAHYMGYLVLRSTDGKVNEVIDGQQRLTTLSLLVLGVLFNLNQLIEKGVDVENTQKRIDGLRQAYIGYLDTVTLVPRSKLSLNRNNDMFYQTYLVPLSEHTPTRRIKASERRLGVALDWFKGKLASYIRDQLNPGQRLAELVDKLSDRLVFTVITVTDELNAYTVFETLNARGVKLSTTDLLKNYLFSVLHSKEPHESEIKSLDDRWERIVGNLESESFPVFLRVHWLSNRGPVRESELFKAIRSQVKTREHVFGLLAGMERDVETYVSLAKPESSAWPREMVDSIKLLKLFGVRQPFALLLTARRILSDPEFATLLRCIVNISFRFNVIGNYHTSESETAYNTEIGRIRSGAHTTVREILFGLKDIYPTDAQFKELFRETKIDTKKAPKRRLARYILGEYEQREGCPPIDIESDAISIEHICPTNPSDNWDEFTDSEVEALSTRIGNLALLEKSINNSIGNQSYQEKHSAYKASKYSATKRLVETYPEWTPATIEARQDGMARAATSMWRVSQFDTA
jgi:Protein of unknown function DUF262/Protein of unknown function (DUF1524)